MTHPATAHLPRAEELNATGPVREKAIVGRSLYRENQPLAGEWVWA